MEQSTDPVPPSTEPPLKKPKRSRFGPKKTQASPEELNQLAAKIMNNAEPVTSTQTYTDWTPGMDDGSTRKEIQIEETFDGPVTKVFVAKLGYEVREEHLRGLFQNYPSVQNVSVVMDREDPMKSRGFGFVEFGDPKEAQEAVNRLNGENLMGRNIVCKISEERNKTQGRPPDWDCSRCGATGCYGSKPTCFKCGAPNPGMPGGGNDRGGGYGNDRGGGYNSGGSGNGGNRGGRAPDWDCLECGAKGCFGSKPTCFRCGAPNPNNSGGGRGGYGDRGGGRDRGRDDRRGGRDRGRDDRRGGRDRDSGYGNDRRGGRNDRGGGYGNDRGGGYGNDRGGGYGNDRGGGYGNDRGGGYGNDRSGGQSYGNDRGGSGGYGRDRDRDYDKGGYDSRSKGPPEPPQYY